MVLASMATLIAAITGLISVRDHRGGPGHKERPKR